MLRTRPWTAVREPLMPDVVAPNVDQNNCSYVTFLQIHYARIQSKLRDGRLPGTIRYVHPAQSLSTAKILFTYITNAVAAITILKCIERLCVEWGAPTLADTSIFTMKNLHTHEV